MHGGFHLNSITLRMSTKQSREGRGLVGVEASVQERKIKIQRTSGRWPPEDELALKDELLSECLRQQKSNNKNEQDEYSWSDKPLHGMYH